MPGMGLTAIGLAGIIISYAGIAHTFIDGMHALTGLTLFIGLIILAVGILDGGVSTSNRAKATVLVIVSIILGFGMYGFTMNTSNFTVTLAGILMGIAFPAIIIAYLAMKHPNIVKPVGSIVAVAAATGIITWLAFGFVSPDTYMIPQQVGIEEPTEEVKLEVEESTEEVKLEVAIPEGAAIPKDGQIYYDPEIIDIAIGTTVAWDNADNTVHTVTSGQAPVDSSGVFDSEIMSTGDIFEFTFTETGTYDYYCAFHAWMVGTVNVE